MSGFNSYLYQEGHQIEYDDENDEWYCSICGRRASIEKGIINPGNQTVLHFGSRDTNYFSMVSTWSLDQT